jgi:hypothetical protein
MVSRRYTACVLVSELRRKALTSTSMVRHAITKSKKVKE